MSRNGLVTKRQFVSPMKDSPVCKNSSTSALFLIMRLSHPMDNALVNLSKFTGMTT